MDILVLGPGESTLCAASAIEKKKDMKVMAFQQSFPNCYTKLDIVPDFWFSADPFAFVEGLCMLLTEDDERLKDMEILVPSFFLKDLNEYRRYCGTTPVMRAQNGWATFSSMLDAVSKKYKVREVKCTSTKYISNNPSSVPEDIFSEEAYYRFMHPEAIMGTIKFDSETVSGLQYMWGLENKLSSAIFPMCYSLRAKNVYVLGFDMQGPRFYSKDDRHPWTDESQTDKEKSIQIPLAMIKRWRQWENLHGMNIYSIAPEQLTRLSDVLPSCEDFKDLESKRSTANSELDKRHTEKYSGGYYMKYTRPSRGNNARAHDRRLREGFYDKYIVGKGLDIGCGERVRSIHPKAEMYDQKLGSGDATFMEDVKDDSYDYVMASHILEHIKDCDTAVKNWYRVVKPGGHLIIAVPERDLFELKKELPSDHNRYHVWYWKEDEAEEPVTLSLREVLGKAVGHENIVYTKTCSEGWEPQPADRTKEMEQKDNPVGEFQIEAVIRKPL